MLGTSKESTLLQAQSSFYKSFAIECSRSQVSVDMWLFSSAYTDVATLSECFERLETCDRQLIEALLQVVCQGTLEVKPTSILRSTLDGQKTRSSLLTSLVPSLPTLSRSRLLCVFVLPRVSCSPTPQSTLPLTPLLPRLGVRMSAFHGNFFVRSTDLLSLAAVPMDQSYAIEIQIEDPISAPFVVFQTAVLHTTCYGERRIRVLTLALPTTSSISELYGSVDTVAMATLLADKAVERSMQAKLEDARDAVVNKLVDILHTYKATMTSAGSGPSPQLVVSDNMKFLPLLLLGLLKHVSVPLF